MPRAFVACIKAHVNLVSGEVFNVGARDQNIQVVALANLVKSLIPETSVVIRSGEPDLVDYHLSCSRIEKILDFTPQWTIERSIEQLRDILREGRYPDPYHIRYHNT